MLRIPHGADLLRRQILHAAEVVHDARPLIVGHGIDGEIPPGQILMEGRRKDHLLGMTAVQVLAVDPVGGDLIARELLVFLPHQDGHRAVLNAGINGPAEQSLHLPGPGGGGDVPVSRLPVQQGIPDTAAHGIGLEACLFQGPQDPRHRFRKGYGYCILCFCQNISPVLIQKRSPAAWLSRPLYNLL